MINIKNKAYPKFWVQAAEDSQFCQALRHQNRSKGLVKQYINIDAMSTFDSLLAGRVWVETELWALPKWPIHKFKPDQQRRKQALRPKSSRFLRKPKKLTKSSPSFLQYVVTVKCPVKILPIFVAFLENMNFTFLIYILCADVTNICRSSCQI